MEIAVTIFSILTVLTAFGVIFSAKPLHSALFLVATLFLVGVHFALLGAQFVAATQVLVYAGAIMVLVIFVIMLLGLNVTTGVRAVNTKLLIATFLAGALLVTLSAAFENSVGRADLAITAKHRIVRAVNRTPVNTLHTSQALAADKVNPAEELAPGSTEDVGQLLFTKYLFAFEVVSVLLLAAVVGATVIALEPKRPLPMGRGLRANQEPTGLQVGERAQLEKGKEAA